MAALPAIPASLSDRLEESVKGLEKFENAGPHDLLKARGVILINGLVIFTRQYSADSCYVA